MSSFGDVTFSVVVEEGMYPGPSASATTPRTYRCEAIFESAADIETMYSMVSQATFHKPLGMTQWIAIIESGQSALLTVPMAGQWLSNDTADAAVYFGALLTSMNVRGSVQRRDKYRVELEFTLPDQVV